MAEVAEKDPAAKKVEDTQEFKDALAKSREEHRLNLEAEYRRKQQDWEAAHPKPTAPPANSKDFFAAWGEKYGLDPDAGRELVAGTLSYVETDTLKPIRQSQKQQEIRSQRMEVRQANPKLAKLDDRFHGEVKKLLDDMDPRLIGADSYARALHMIIGQHYGELDEERGKEGREAEGKDREVAPGHEPLPDSGGGKPSKVILSAYQQRLCDEKGWDHEFFVDLIRTRARKMEADGVSKPDIRKRLGDSLGSIEF